MDPWLILSTGAALLFFVATGLNVVSYRVRHKIPAPAMHGHPEVERALRVQGNTLEWLVIFVPSLWMFGIYFDGRIAAAVTAVWVLGRFLYMRAYVQDPLKRRNGFLLQLAATAVLLFCAMGAAVWQMFVGGEV